MRLTIILAIPVTAFLLACSSGKGPDISTDYDLMIVNGTIVDGSGSEGYPADILIHNGVIVHAREFNSDGIQAKTVIDATGKAVTPGFIDLHSHGDPFLTPDFENFLAMGVTTITLGQDGFSPEYDDYTDWMNRVDQLRPGTNIVIFIGHNTVRKLDFVPLQTAISDRDIERMQERIRLAMEAGVFGLTTGLEYDPGRFAGREELKAIAEPVAEHGGLVMSHLRTEDNGAVEDALLELITQGRDAGVPVHVSHIKIVLGNNPAAAGNLLQIMEMAGREGLPVTADVYPYTASFTGTGLLFPDWAKPPNIYEDVVSERRRDLQGYLRNRVMTRNGPDATLLGTGEWAGKTLAEVASELGKPFEDVLIDDIGLDGASAAFFVMNEDVLRRFIRARNVSVSSDGSPAMLHPRGYGSFARIIRKYVVEENLITLEQAVHKMSGQSADILGLHNKPEGKKRGYIRPGYAADILVFDPAGVRDNAIFDDPHILATGFDYVIVNGNIVRSNDRPTGNRSGRVLRRPGREPEK